MHAAAVGVAQKEDEKQGIDQEHILYRVISFLPALTLFLFNRVLGADDASFGAVMGQRGAAGISPGASSSALTTLAASAAETPSRCARAGRERAGACHRGGGPPSTPGGGIAKGAEGRQQHGEEHVDPLIGLALAHAEQATLHHLESVRFHIRQNKQ